MVAIDIDDPARYDWPHPRPEVASRPANVEPGVKQGSALAHRELDSRAKRVDVSVYEASVEALGTFDFAFMGALMLHLRDPVKTLAFDDPDPPARARRKALRHRRAALVDSEPGRAPSNDGGGRVSGGPVWRAIFHAIRRRPPRVVEPSWLIFELFTRRLGAPCAWALCEPA